MADIKIDEELLLRAGLGIGYAFAPFFRGILEGVEDYTIEQAAREMQEEHDAQEAEEGLKRPVEKTLIGDCRKCWCDQCAKLEQCVHLREGALPDGVRPTLKRRRNRHTSGLTTSKNEWIKQSNTSGGGGFPAASSLQRRVQQ